MVKNKVYFYIFIIKIEKNIIFFTLQFRNAVENKDRIWDDGIVPYEISDEYSTFY